MGRGVNTSSWEGAQLHKASVCSEVNIRTASYLAECRQVLVEVELWIQAEGEESLSRVKICAMVNLATM